MTKDESYNSQDQNDQYEPIDIGIRLRKARIREGLTLKEVSNRANISESFLSQLERGRANASIASLQRISKALNTSLGELFESASSSDVKVIRKNERPSLIYGVMGRKSLLTPITSKYLEVFIGEFDTGGSTGETLYNHGDSEELLFVIEGKFEVQVGKHIYTLSEGDCINYRSSNPHSAKNIGNSIGKVMWIISPPSM